jgi:hypothetical protein
MNSGVPGAAARLAMDQSILAKTKFLIGCQKQDQGQKDALAWMRAQARIIKPSVPEDASVYQLAGIISSKISLKKRRVQHRKICTCSVVDMGYTTVVQMTLAKDCPFHKHYIRKQGE